MNWSELVTYKENDMLVDINNYRTILELKLRVKEKENVLKAIRLLDKRTDIISAEPDFIQILWATHPNAINLRSQWALKNLQLPKAWDMTTGTSTTLVGVIDSGIDGTHPDLANRLERNLCADFTTTNWLGSPKTTMTPNPVDTQGHGTHVAGIIGAQGINNGITGVAWDVRIVSLRVFNPTAPLSRIIKAIDFASEKNIPILNFSGGGRSGFSASQQRSIVNYPGLLICAAGNNNTDNDNIFNYPSHYLSDKVISVGAIKSNNTRPTAVDWGYDSKGNPQGSNFGVTKVDIFAPGDNIMSTVPTTINTAGYSFKSGTSMAAPYVTGVAAIIKSIRPNLTSAQIKSAIVGNATSVDELSRLCRSAGRLNAFDAVKSVSHHIHTYSHTWVDLRQHKSICSCGDIRVRGHIVSGSWNGVGHTTCLECRGPAELGFVIQNDKFDKVTDTFRNCIANYFGTGSVILNNGVIVLSDIDLIKYYNDTLIIPEECEKNNRYIKNFDTRASEDLRKYCNRADNVVNDFPSSILYTEKLNYLPMIESNMINHKVYAHIY